MKGAASLSRCDDPAMRRVRRRPIEDHDGGADERGGLRRWLKPAEAVGVELDAEVVASGAACAW